jgi:hypothetical protein
MDTNRMFQDDLWSALKGDVTSSLWTKLKQENKSLPSYYLHFELFGAVNRPDSSTKSGQTCGFSGQTVWRTNDAFMDVFFDRCFDPCTSSQQKHSSRW